MRPRTMKGHSRFSTWIRTGILTALAMLAACAFRPDNAADRAMTARVEAALEKYPALQTPNRITVQAVGTVVYLRGLVSTPYQAGLAGEVAANAAPGLHIVNIIAVENTR